MGTAPNNAYWNVHWWFGVEAETAVDPAMTIVFRDTYELLFDGYEPKF